MTTQGSEGQGRVEYDSRGKIGKGYASLGEKGQARLSRAG